MERKLIQQGGGGFTIYLPKQWVQARGLGQGDRVAVSEAGTSLLVSSSTQGKKTISLDISTEQGANIRNILTHLYRSGYEEIALQGLSTQARKSAIDTTQALLLGFEVTTQDDRAVTITNISEPSGEKYEVLLRRIFLIIKETATLVAQDISEGSYIHEKEVGELRRQQDKFVLFCRRILRKEMRANHTLTQWELLTFLMHIEHAYGYLYGYACANGVKAKRPVVELLASLSLYLDTYIQAYVKQDIESISLLNRQKELYQFGSCYDLLEQSKRHETVLLSHIREIFRLIQVGSSPLLAELLDR